MGYSGVRGGMEAIRAAERLVRHKRDHADAPWVSGEQITQRFRLAVDRIMGPLTPCLSWRASGWCQRPSAAPRLQRRCGRGGSCRDRGR